MKKPTRLPTLAASLAAIGAALAVFSNSAQAQPTFQSVSNGLVSFYPLDYVITNGATLTTPDHIGGRDLILSPATTAANVIASDRSQGGAVSNCFNLNQSGGATVLFYNSTGQNPLDITNSEVSDFLPFCNQINATMNLWIKGAAPGTDTRFFGEAANDGNNDPLWLWGDHSSAAGKAHLLMRLSATTNYLNMSDGTRQSPVGVQQVQGDNWTAATILDNTWHMFTIVKDANGFFDVYVDGVRDPGGNASPPAPVYTNSLGETTVVRFMPVTNTWYTTNIYPKSTPPAANPPPHGYVAWVMNSIFTGGSTAFGGFKRGGVNGGLAVQMDNIAFWNRALSAEEIQFIYANGLPQVALTRPLVIQKFVADVAEVGKGDVATLSWIVSGASTTPGSITISGVGDVTSIGAIGSIDVPMNGGDQTFTMTVTNTSTQLSKSKSASVKVFPGVDSNWHLFQRFDGLYTDTDQGIATDVFNIRTWNSSISSFAGFFDRFNVVTLTTGSSSNKVLSPTTGYVPNGASVIGFDSRGALAYANLNSLTIGPNESKTLFFRFSLRDPQSWATTYGVYSDLDLHIGLTDYNFWDGPAGGGPAPAELFDRGPEINIVRATTSGFTQPEPFNLRAYAWSGTGTTNTYSYRDSVSATGLETNVNYMLWMDIESRNPGYNSNAPAATTNMALYSVYLQKQGGPRELLFKDFPANRNFAPVTILGPNTATPFLDKFFVNQGTESILNSVVGAYFETNMIAIDDLYISKNGFESSIPRLFDLTSVVRDTSGVTIKWNSLGSLFETVTYTVQRKTNLTDATWTTVVSGYPSGGETTTYQDTTVGNAPSAYYRITYP